MDGSGQQEWLPGGRHLQVGVGVLWVLLGMWNLLDASDTFGRVLAVVLIVSAAAMVVSALSYRVRADDGGVEVRNGWGQTRRVVWDNVADVRRGSRFWSGSTLVLTSREGWRVGTGLRVKDGHDLLTRWRLNTGRATLEDYAALDLEDYAGSR